HDDVVKLFGIGDVSEQRFVGVFGRGPVRAVHLGVVETVLHHPPGFLEDLLAFGGQVDFHADGERDAPGGGTGGGGFGSCRRACAGATSAASAASAAVPLSSAGVA